MNEQEAKELACEIVEVGEQELQEVNEALAAAQEVKFAACEALSICQLKSYTHQLKTILCLDCARHPSHLIS